MLALETQRLILRPGRPDELETIYRILVREIEGESFTMDDFEAERAFDLHLAQQPLGVQFGRPSIFLKAENRYIGYCLLMPRLCTPEELTLYGRLPATPPRRASLEAEMGWAISELYRGNGYSTEAAHALVDYGLRDLRFPRIIAFTTRSNLASIRVMEKLGMRIGRDRATDAVAGMIENETAYGASSGVHS